MTEGPRIAVVGCGYWGPNLVRNFNALPSCEMAMVCDFSRERLNRMQDLYPDVATVTDFEAIERSEELDAVAIATPVAFHFDLAKRALLSGKHVFVEKPLASSVAQGLELVQLAAERNLTLMVGHTFVYCAPVQRIKEIIDDGELGKILYVSSRRLNLGLFQKDINVAWDLAPHDISIILYLLNKMPVSVNCQGKAHLRPGIEDVTNMSLNYANGRFATIQSSWLDPNKIREMTIVGDQRMLVYDDLAPLEKIKIYDKRVERPPHYDTYAEFHYAYHYGDSYCPYLRLVEPLSAECQHFLDCMASGDSPRSGGREGLQVLQILEAASESLRMDGACAAVELESRLNAPAQPIAAAR